MSNSLEKKNKKTVLASSASYNANSAFKLTNAGVLDE